MKNWLSTRTKREQKAHSTCLCSVLASLPQIGSWQAWSSMRPAAGGEEMEMPTSSSKDCPDPYVKTPTWGFPDMEEEYELKEVVLGEGEGTGSMSVVLQQSCVCVLGVGVR